MEDTIGSIQATKHFRPFMLERLYNQVCSKCVDGVLDLSSYRGALNDLGSQGPGAALDTLLAVLATARALRRRLRRATLPSSSRRPHAHRPVSAFTVRTATFADLPPSLTRLPCRPTALAYACRRTTLADAFAAAPANVQSRASDCVQLRPADWYLAQARCRGRGPSLLP